MHVNTHTTRSGFKFQVVTPSLRISLFCLVWGLQVSRTRPVFWAIGRLTLYSCGYNMRLTCASSRLLFNSYFSMKQSNLRNSWFLDRFTVASVPLMALGRQVFACLQGGVSRGNTDNLIGERGLVFCNISW